MTSGNRINARWFRNVLHSRFEIKTVVVGTGSDESAEARVLERSNSFNPEGWEYEADQRHGEIIVQETGMSQAKPTVTPTAEEKEEEDDDQPTTLRPRSPRVVLNCTEISGIHNQRN